MRVLLTNDDGIRAEGLRAMYRALREAGHTVHVVAPMHEQSGVGHSLTFFDPLRAHKIEEPDFEGLGLYGTPTDCVKLALGNLLKKRPDARLMLVGDGYLEGAAREMAAPMGGRVIFAGSVPDPEKYLCAMDVMALPSRFEGFPTVLLEWQCAGLPVLVSSRVTDEAALTPLLQYLPLEAGAEAWAGALLALPRRERAQASRAAAAMLKAGGYALEDAAALLARFYQSLSPGRRK